jgi:PAS domain S-box-containing protein
MIGAVTDITELKLAEENLKASERQFRRLIESIPIGIFIYDGTKICYLNPACERITGYKRDELYMLDIWEVVHPKFKDTVVEYVQRRQQGAPESEPRAVKIVTKSGEERWLDGSGVAVELEGKPLVLVAVMDITERKHAGEALRKSEEKYHAVLENASDAILLTDEHGNILEVNRKAEELLGYIKEEFLQMNYTQLHPMIELERTIDAFKKIVEQGYGTLQDGSICRKDGKVVPVDITGSVIQYAGMKVIQGSFRDISEHKHAADSLERLVKKRTAELTTKNEQLIMEIKERKRAEASLRKRTNELQLNSNKLSELNAALKVLLIQRDEDKRELEEKVMANVKELLLPYLEELKTGRLDARNKVQVSILEANLKNIISPFTHRLSSKYSGFTPREIQVANLIRQGKSTKEIAEYVGVSRSAINLYRNGIRSKLGIISKKINLRSHLMSLS